MIMRISLYHWKKSFFPDFAVGVVSAVAIGSLLLLVACGGGGGGGGGSALPPSSVTISGTVFAAAGNRIDSDVLDPRTTPVSNDTISQAQAIAGPAVVGGYVDSADTSDFYQVDLVAGERVILSLPGDVVDDVVQNPAIEIRFNLYDGGQTQINSVVADRRSTALSVSADGTYFIEVRIAGTAAGYKLIVGDGAALTASSSDPGLAAEFVPGEAVVCWRANAPARDARGRLAMTTAATAGGDRFELMRFATEDQVRAVYDRLGMGSDRMAARRMPDADIDRQRRYDTLQIVRSLRRRTDVEFAEPNYIRHTRLIPNDPLYDQQWHYPNINLPAAWDITRGAASVIVAVIDTGVLPDHPDLSTQLVEGYDFVSDPVLANDGESLPGAQDDRDENPTDPGGSFLDSSFHGTHVSGTIGAAMTVPPATGGVGGTGIAPGARIMPVRVLGEGGGTDFDIIAGILFAAGANDIQTSTGLRPAQPADIINMSLGGPGASATLDAAIAEARSRGVIVVAAAGNSATSQPEFPAASPGVISVAATDFNGQRTVYTNYGPFVDVAAPGGDQVVDLDQDGNTDGVLSTSGEVVVQNGTTSIQPTYLYAQGTSMASPHMAGVAALMKSVRPGLTPDELDAYLAGGAITNPLVDNTGLGAGLIDAQAAVLAAQAGGPATVLQAAPNAFHFDNDSAAATLDLNILGGGAVTGITVTAVIDDPADPAWLSVTPAVNPNQYIVDVDRSNLAGGIHTGFVDVQSSANNFQVPVRLEVLPDPQADAGFQYILVVDANSLVLVAKQAMTFSGGAYTFSVSGLAPGSYFLLAGTDMDNDGLSLDAGEAFGAYPNAIQTTALTVSADTPGITFTTGFSLEPFVTAHQLTVD